MKKLLVATLFLFVASNLLITAHTHSASKGEKESSCSICQISHSHTKSLSGSVSFQTLDLKPLFSLFIPNFSEVSSEKATTSLIRGPPFLS